MSKGFSAIVPPGEALGQHRLRCLPSSGSPRPREGRLDFAPQGRPCAPPGAGESRVPWFRMAAVAPQVALAVSGSIAAYKAVEVARRLVAEGVAVVPIMTDSAIRFLGPLTLSGICAAPVLRDMFDPAAGGEAHVDIGGRVDLVLVVPATADLLA